MWVGCRRALVVPTCLALLVSAGCATRQPPLASLPLRDVEECGLGPLYWLRNLDLAIAIDTSESTGDPSGFDINENGVVGWMDRLRSTDRGDSVLAAEIKGIRSFLSAAEHEGLRFAIVSFAGQDRFGDPVSPELGPDAVLRTRPSREHPQVAHAALDRVWRRGSRGTTNFAAGMRLGVRWLERLGETQGRRRAMVMIAASPAPLMPGPTVYIYRTPGDPNGSVVRTDPHMAKAAMRAIRLRVPIHTFGLGEATDAKPPHMLSRIAGATAGSYRSVADPRYLHCELLAALEPPPPVPVRTADAL